MSIKINLKYTSSKYLVIALIVSCFNRINKGIIKLGIITFKLDTVLKLKKLIGSFVDCFLVISNLPNLDKL